MIVPVVTDTVTGKLIAFVPSENVIVVEPLLLAPSPIDVSVNTPDDAGDVVVDTVTDGGETVTIDVSLLTAVNVPLKPFSVTVTDWLALLPPNATLAGLATGVGDGVGVGLGEADGLAPGLTEALGCGEAPPLGVVLEPPPPPPQPTSTANATIP